MAKHKADPDSALWRPLSGSSRSTSARSGRHVASKAPGVSNGISGASYGLVAALTLGAVFGCTGSAIADRPVSGVSAVSPVAVNNVYNRINEYLKPRVTSTPKAAPSPIGITKETPLVAAPPTVPDQAPSTLLIPDLGITAPIVASTITDNKLVIPESGSVGLYSGGSTLEATEGTTLIVGHVNFADGSPGALSPLSDAKPGEVIKASGSDGVVHEFRVESEAEYLKQQLPDEVFTTTGRRVLVVITCGGPIVRVRGVLAYSSNVVVTAVPIN